MQALIDAMMMKLHTVSFWPRLALAIMCVTFIVLVPSHYCISQSCLYSRVVRLLLCQEYVLPRNTIWFH